MLKREAAGDRIPDVVGGPPFRPIPELPRRLGFYLSAFYELSTSRQMGMAVGPIPFEAIDRYATRYGVRNFERFRSLIRALDNAWMGTQNKARPEAQSDMIQNAVSANDVEGVKAFFRGLRPAT